MGARDRLLQANAANITPKQETSTGNLVETIAVAIPTPVGVQEENSVVTEIPVQDVAETTQIPVRVSDMAETTQDLNSSTNFTFTTKKKRTKDKFTTIRLYPELYDQIDVIAKQNDTSFNEVLNQVLAQFFCIDLE